MSICNIIKSACKFTRKLSIFLDNLILSWINFLTNAKSILYIVHAICNPIMLTCDSTNEKSIQTCNLFMWMCKFIMSTCKIKYVNKHDNYINMRLINVSRQNNYMFTSTCAMFMLHFNSLKKTSCMYT